MALTPMMQQYLDIKEQNPGTILFYRLGDFYEMFFDDALLASRELELTLTGRDCGLKERAPMCGVPYHAVDVYINRLIEKGYRVAICEQMTDPADSKGLVERAVTRIISPGTVVEAELLDENASNYIVSICLSRDKAGLAFSDVSTGEFFVYQLDRAAQRLGDELSRIAPREVLVNDPERFAAIAVNDHFATTAVDPATFEGAAAAKMLCEQFHVAKPAELGLDGQKLALQAAGALLAYLHTTQKNALSHILTIRQYESERHMIVDRVAAYNLELVQSTRDRNRKGSLLWTLNETATSMGSRMLKSWVEQPLLDPGEIDARLDAVADLMAEPMLMDELRERLNGVYDIERLLSKIAYDSVNARDALALLASLEAVPGLREALAHREVALLSEVRGLLTPLEELTDLLERAISKDAPLSVKDGGIIRPGYDEKLDKLRTASTSGKDWIADLERKEREATGIKNLKVGFNRVFGYYIEVTKSFYNLVPYRYVRKQTLANCERFITDELKQLEKTVLGADDEAVRLEYALFVAIRAILKENLPHLQRIAQGLKTLDALLALATVALKNDYVRPRINPEGVIEIKNGRHPVVEQSLGRAGFVPNDTHIDETSRVMVITGPNMAGKSTYMRQVALIVLMAHMGSFVPAEAANIAVTDRIFTRIGASDDLYGGQSTFMVEMNELATILKFATPRSLLLLDEVGRGTSTFDGLSIAWAAVEYIAGKKCGARALFSTHYHELTELEGQLDGVVNYRITAREQGDDIIFLRRIVPGGADRSFGVAVASLAGLPSSLIARARQIMARLEITDEAQGSIGKSILDKRKNAGNRQISLNDYKPMELVEEIRAIDVMGMSPIDALNKLYTLQEKARLI